MAQNFNFLFSICCLLLITSITANIYAESDLIQTKKIIISRGLENDNSLDLQTLSQKVQSLELELKTIQEQLKILENKSNLTEVKGVSNNTPIVSPISKEKESYDLALAALKDQKYEEAEQKFENFIVSYPKSLLQSNAHFWYSESFYRRSIFDKAAINYLKGYKQYPKGAKAADSLLKLSLALGAINKKAESCNILTKLETEFPNRSVASIKRAKDAKVKFGCKN